MTQACLDPPLARGGRSYSPVLARIRWMMLQPGAALSPPQRLEGSLLVRAPSPPQALASLHPADPGHWAPGGHSPTVCCCGPRTGSATGSGCGSPAPSAPAVGNCGLGRPPPPRVPGKLLTDWAHSRAPSTCRAGRRRAQTGCQHPCHPLLGYLTEASKGASRRCPRPKPPGRSVCHRPGKGPCTGAVR